MEKPFYKKVSFYLMAVVVVITFFSLVLYAANCASEFNGGEVSSTVVMWEVIALIAAIVAVCGNILKSFVAKDSLGAKILNYIRFVEYFVFLALFVSFVETILEEYQLFGTILYHIVSGTVGDPVDPVLSASFFIALIGLLVAFILALVSGLLQKGAAYKEEKKAEAAK